MDKRFICILCYIYLREKMSLCLKPIHFYQSLIACVNWMWYELGFINLFNFIMMQDLMKEHVCMNVRRVFCLLQNTFQLKSCHGYKQHIVEFHINA